MLEDAISLGPESAEGQSVVILTGEIDLGVAPSLRQRLADLVAEGRSRICVDLLGATFLDSVALGVLVGALEQCREAGGDLCLVVTEERILRVLEITGLASTFTIRSSNAHSRGVDHGGGGGRLGEVSKHD
jgi:anti-sigma B factor antagonist